MEGEIMYLKTDYTFSSASPDKPNLAEVSVLEVDEEKGEARVQLEEPHPFEKYPTMGSEGDVSWVETRDLFENPNPKELAGS